MAEVVSGILRDSISPGRQIEYGVVLPAAYRLSKQRFRVVYLLHGLFGSCRNWIELTKLTSYCDRHHLIVVTPEGGDSWYVDSIAANGEKFENYILKDLVPAIDALFRTRSDRRSRGIAGNSMGGYGAIKFAFKRPDMFSFAASSSGAFHGPQLSERNTGEGWKEMAPSITRAFGDAESESRRTNDLSRITEVLSRSSQQIPEIFFDCGKADSFLEVNRKFHRTLKQFGIAHAYKEYSGGHDWKYWDKRIQAILQLADEKLK